MPRLIPSVTYLKRLTSLVNRTPLNSKQLVCTRGVYSVKVSQKSANRLARRGVRVPRLRGDRPAPGEAQEAEDPGRAQAAVLQEALEDSAALRLARQFTTFGRPLRA